MAVTRRPARCADWAERRQSRQLDRVETSQGERREISGKHNPDSYADQDDDVQDLASGCFAACGDCMHDSTDHQVAADWYTRISARKSPVANQQSFPLRRPRPLPGATASRPDCWTVASTWMPCRSLLARPRFQPGSRHSCTATTVASRSLSSKVGSWPRMPEFSPNPDPWIPASLRSGRPSLREHR